MVKDIKRKVLLIALAAVGYLLIWQWNKDYGQVNLPPETLQTQNTAVEKSNLDVPQIINETQIIQELNSLENINNNNSNHYVTVTTDTFNLVIDKRGGDIVQLRLLKYPRRQDRPDIPFQLFDNGSELIYLAQSGLIGINAPDKSSGRAVWSSAKNNYELTANDHTLIVDLVYSENNIEYTKQFVFERDKYEIDVRYKIHNNSDTVWIGNMFAQLKRDDSSDPSTGSAASTATYLGAAIWTPDKPYKKISIKDIKKSPLKENITGGWVAWLQHYFVTAWIPNKNDSHVVQTRQDAQGNYIVGFTSPTLNIVPGANQEISAKLYAGPKIQKHLAQLSPGLELTVDYGFLWFIAQPIFWLLEQVHNILGNWGWSIIVLTCLIKLAFFPLSAASYKSMAKMRLVAPKIQALKDRFGDDKQKMSQEMMLLYRQEKINPLGGCLPILLQMPVFLALYWVLLESVEMRQAPWLGWISDLSIKDPYFILPLIMGATMFIQHHLNPAPPDPMQAKVMKMMPIVFTFFFLWFPSGLVLYWVVNNVLSIAQQWYVMRLYGNPNSVTAKT